MKNFRLYATISHIDTMQLYDDKLYAHHLKIVENIAMDFQYLIVNIIDFIDIVLPACWCHDLISDARQTYNDVKSNTSIEVAEIVRAVTEDVRGRTRIERMPDYIYEEIKNTKYATFVKLCDRIANVTYSKESKSSMFNKYKKEHEHFKEMLYTLEYKPMWEHLDKLFEIWKN